MSGHQHSYMPASADVLKEWKEARCPVCLEPPHNAVLLVCSSQAGCHTFICDTSYRHSNCLDRLFKASSQSQGGGYNQQLRCLICGEPIKRCSSEKNARSYMDAKVRSCSLESCSFEGTYQELRKHARREHPFARPSEVEPDRQIAWQQIEDLWELHCLTGSQIHDDYDAPEDQITENEEVLEVDDPHVPPPPEDLLTAYAAVLNFINPHWSRPPPNTVETDPTIIWLRCREEGTLIPNDSDMSIMAVVHGRVAIWIEQGVQIKSFRVSIEATVVTYVIAEPAGTRRISETNQFTGQTLEFIGHMWLDVASGVLFNIWPPNYD